jgi:hypothetical protein
LKLRSASVAELGGVAPIVAVVVLVLNDHVLKRLFHNGVTGKLSDLAICFLMPLLVSAIVGVVVPWRVEMRLRVGAVVASAVFASLEMSDTAAAAFNTALSWLGFRHMVMTRDPSDLLALIMVPVAVAYGDRRLHAAPQATQWAKTMGAMALSCGVLALLATSPLPLCDRWSAPVIFQVDAGCGPGGIVVVEVDEYSGYLSIANPAALGLTSRFPSDGSEPTRGQYRGTSCPYLLAEEEWDATVGSCTVSSTPDGGSTTRTCTPMYRECRTELVAGELFFVCTGAEPSDQPLCRARLTVMP